MSKKTRGKKTEAQAALADPTPVRARDLASLRYALGLNYTDLRYLLGGTSATIAQGSDNDRVLSPSLGILVRLLWNDPADAPSFQGPDFNHIRARFGPAFKKVAGRGSGRGKGDGAIPKTLAACLSGTAQGAGSEWSLGRQQPSPTVQRLFWLLDLWADKFGEEAAVTRWLAAVDEEARARGSSLGTLLDKKSWPRLPEEKRYRSASKDEGSDDADE